MLPVGYRALNSLPLVASRGAARRFHAALNDPGRIQEEILLQLLRRNARCTWGQQYGFNSIRSVQEFQQRVPVVSYDDLSPWIERMKAGEQGVLVDEPIVMFEKSSGSVSPAKYIPYTRTLRAQFQAALAPWIADLHRSFPSLADGSAYWLVTPLAKNREVTKGGIPVGFESDTEYFGALQGWVLKKILAVPPELAAVHDLEDCLYLTLRFLLQERRLTFISVWNPSFLQILLDRLEIYGDRLVRDLLDGKGNISSPLPSPIANALRSDSTQARILQGMLSRGRVEPTVLWRALTLISCWTSAESAGLTTQIQERFPGVAVQGKGLLATEGVISIPIEQYRGCVAAITSHFLEFMEPSSGTCSLVSELREGTEYSVLLTTGGGLWRYQLRDRVRVTGFARRTPILEFIGKEDNVSDLRGEKLNAIFVANVLGQFESCRKASFSMLAPSDAAVPHYTLFLEGQYCEPDLAFRVDAKLRENPHYAYCRALGQLADLKLFLIPEKAREAYLNACEARGQRAGAVKITSMHKNSGWEHIFTGRYADNPVEVCA